MHKPQTILNRYIKAQKEYQDCYHATYIKANIAWSHKLDKLGKAQGKAHRELYRVEDFIRAGQLTANEVHHAEVDAGLLEDNPYSEKMGGFKNFYY